jgi:hypothetical protein
MGTFEQAAQGAESGEDRLHFLSHGRSFERLELLAHLLWARCVAEK